MTDKHKPKRRWLQFSLRTLFVVVTVFCILLGLYAKRARDRKLAVEAILDVGGIVVYEHEMPRKYPSEPPGPEWLRQLLGDEYFFSVFRVTFWGANVDDASLAAIKPLTDVNDLRLHGTNITDAGLVHLKRLTNLTHLNLMDTMVTDAGLLHLKGLTNLKRLLLYGTEITDARVSRLRQALPNCQIIH